MRDTRGSHARRRPRDHVARAPRRVHRTPRGTAASHRDTSRRAPPAARASRAFVVHAIGEVGHAPGPELTRPGAGEPARVVVPYPCHNDVARNVIQRTQRLSTDSLTRDNVATP